MLKATLWHEPTGHVFYVQGSDSWTAVGPELRAEVDRQGLAVRGSLAAVHTVSEYTAVPITVEFHRHEPGTSTDAWDFVRECQLTVKGPYVTFESGTADEFGRLEVPPGNYRLRVFFGGQATPKPDGSTEDFYVVQIWPNSLADAVA